MPWVRRRLHLRDCHYHEFSLAPTYSCLVTAHHGDTTSATDRGFQLGRPAARSIGTWCWEAIAITTADQPFAREAAMGGWRKSSWGIWGRRKAWNADVKQFADGMVTDHGKANDELKQSAQQTRVTFAGGDRREAQSDPRSAGKTQGTPSTRPICTTCDG